MFISKGFLKHKQVQISDKKERRFRDMVTLFSSSDAAINYQAIRSEYLPLVKQCEKKISWGYFAWLYILKGTSKASAVFFLGEVNNL